MFKWLKRKEKEPPRFKIATRSEGTVEMTAEELASRVVKDAEKSDYGWIATPTELLYITALPGFDQRQAEQILIRMANCYANLLGPTHDVFASDYMMAGEILGRLKGLGSYAAEIAIDGYFSAFAYRATGEPFRWTGIFGEFCGPAAQEHIRLWCKKKGKSIGESYRGASPVPDESGSSAELQFSPGSPLMERLENEFSEELKRMRESGEFDAENAAQEKAYAELARATMGFDDRDIDHGESEGD